MVAPTAGASTERDAAMLCDDILEHGLTVGRALESWFFASSVYPETSTPLVV